MTGLSILTICRSMMSMDMKFCIYAQEKMHDNAELFDYTTVEYLDPEKNLIGNEEGFLEEVTENTRLAQLSDGSWILGENGTFVNRLKEDIRIEGKKIWGNVPRGFDKAVLPKATFTIYQKLEEEKGEGSEWCIRYDQRLVETVCQCSIPFSSGIYG